MTSQHPHDLWNSGSAYEAYVGRWSRQVARDFIRWLGLPSGLAWADIGCGTGALAATILDQAGPLSVTGVDRSTEFVAYTHGRGTDPRTAFVAGDGTAIPLARGAVGAAVSGLVLNFVPDPQLMASEMARIVRKGGAVALYVWDYAGEMQMMRHFWDTAVELDPAAESFDEARRFSVCRPERLRALFEAAGLSSIETRDIDVATTFRDFDDYWTPFLGGTGTAPGYVASLSDEAREALREALRARLPVSADGSISLIARALAIRGAV